MSVKNGKALSSSPSRLLDMGSYLKWQQQQSGLSRADPSLKELELDVDNGLSLSRETIDLVAPFLFPRLSRHVVQLSSVQRRRCLAARRDIGAKARVNCRRGHQLQVPGEVV